MTLQRLSFIHVLLLVAVCFPDVAPAAESTETSAATQRRGVRGKRLRRPKAQRRKKRNRRRGKQELRAARPRAAADVERRAQVQGAHRDAHQRSLELVRREFKYVHYV